MTSIAQQAAPPGIQAAEENPAVRWIIAVLTVVIFGAIVTAIYVLPHPAAGAAPGILPTVNAALNASCAVLLVSGWVCIRRRRFVAHKACMVGAVVLSTAFLVTYLMHHVSAGSVPYQGGGVMKGVYLAFLIPHVLLALPIVPLALFTIYRGWTGRFAKHKKIARWTLPLWLWVSVSGVIVYVMLYHL
jgi:putative membrane protein